MALTFFKANNVHPYPCKITTQTKLKLGFGLVEKLPQEPLRHDD